MDLYTFEAGYEESTTLQRPSHARRSLFRPWMKNEEKLLVTFVSLYCLELDSAWPKYQISHPLWEEAATFLATKSGGEYARPVLDESKCSTQLLYSALHKLTLERIYEYIGANVSSKCGEVTSTKPEALRSLMCGYRLHAAGHVQSPEYNSGPDLFSCYFRVNVKPAMKTTETYVVVVKLHRFFGHVMSTMCTCKAG